MQMIHTSFVRILFGIIIIGSIVFRFFNPAPAMQDFHTLSCIGDMAMGALGAYLCTLKDWKYRFENLGKPVIILTYVAVIGAFLFRGHIFWGNDLLHIFDRTLISIVFLMVIIEQNFARNSLFKFSKLKPLSRLGVISFGLYCYHPLTISIVAIIFTRLHLSQANPLIFIVQLIAGLIATIIVALLSYKIIEKPFLRLKLKYSYIVKGQKDL
ncbi:MAG: acyltransferase [Pedobacter sp.]|nr:MAG: acyltransferase [Pedobacter sp.]